MKNTLNRTKGKGIIEVNMLMFPSSTPECLAAFRRTSLFLRVTLVLASSAICALAQTESGQVRLTVSDPSGLALPSSGSLGSDASHTQRVFAMTDDSRRWFTFDHLPFGIYRLVVEHIGFQRYTTLIEIRSAIPREVAVQMTIQPTATEVNVTAAATLLDAHRTGVIYSVGSQSLNRVNSNPLIPARSILDLVNMQPGWLLEANGVLHPRGSENQTLFVVDGVPMDENRSPGFAPEFDREDSQSMSILTGNYPAEYGRKLGGVVEVTTDKDLRRGFHGTAEASGGSFDTGSGFLAASYGWNGSALTVSAFGARTDHYLDPPVLGNFTNSATLDGLTAVFDHDLSPAEIASTFPSSASKPDSRCQMKTSRKLPVSGRIVARSRTSAKRHGRTCFPPACC